MSPHPATRSTTTRWQLILISLCVLMALQVIRVFVTTLVYAFGERFGQTLAALPALIVFLSPLLVPLIARLLTPRRALLITIGGLAATRLLMQLSRNIDLTILLAALTLMLALMGLALAFAWSSAAGSDQWRRFGLGILLGLTLDAASQGAFLTWDYVWQPGLLPLLVAVIVSGLVLFALWQLRAEFNTFQPQEPRVRTALPVIALGPFFALEMLYLQNVAFVASSGLMSLEAALAVILISVACALLAFSVALGQSLLVRLIAAAALIITALLLPISNGPIVIALILIGQCAAAMLLPSILCRLAATDTRSGVWRMSVIVVVGGLLFIVPLILYYISVLITLPFSYTVVPAVEAIIVGLTLFVAPPKLDRFDRRIAAIPLGLLLIPLVLFLTRSAMPLETNPIDHFQFFDYNTHQTISFDGWLNPEGTAAVIEAQHPDVVVLQEISRGWLIAGGLDVAEWLSRRLQMPYVYAPGHDYQFGNIILTRRPIKEWSWARLPLQNVPLGRGLIRAAIDLGNNRIVNVINTHLSAYATSADRIPQVQKLLEVWNQAPRSLIAGDMNAHPEDSDIALFLQSGLISAQDATKQGDLLTFSSAEPVERIDWILGSPDIQFSDFVIPQTTASDHLPLAAKVTLP